MEGSCLGEKVMHLGVPQPLASALGKDKRELRKQSCSILLFYVKAVLATVIKKSLFFLSHKEYFLGEFLLI